MNQLVLLKWVTRVRAFVALRRSSAVRESGIIYFVSPCTFLVLSVGSSLLSSPPLFFLVLLPALFPGYRLSSYRWDSLSLLVVPRTPPWTLPGHSSGFTSSVSITASVLINTCRT